MNEKPYTTPNRRKGDAIILQAYNHIRENGPATASELCDITGCDMQTVGSPRVMRFNEFMRENKFPHLFSASRGGKHNGPVTWSLRERK